MTIDVSPRFEKELKRLAKKYKKSRMIYDFSNKNYCKILKSAYRLATIVTKPDCPTRRFQPEKVADLGLSYF